MELEMLKLVGQLQSPILDNYFIFFTKIGDLGLVWILIATIMIFRQKTRKYGMVLFITLFINLIVGEGILKNIFDRPRPFEAFPFNLLVDMPITSSFPSGHTAASFAAFGVFVFYIKKWIIPVGFLSVSISLSRIYLQLHYPSDVLFGAALGLLVAYIVTKVLKKYNFFTLE